MLEERRFESRIGTFLRENVAALAGMQPDAHRRQVRASIATARHFDFVTEREIATFALSAALLGPDFHTTMGGAKQILTLDKPAEYRAKLLEYFTRELFDILAEG